ncbi:MAG: HlyU family transcriptional regulator [Granulosicoccus sp.]
MGFGDLLGKIFGGGGDSADAPAEAAEAIEYNGFTITAAPIKEGGQFKTAGSISKEIEGELRSAQFIRADNHSDRQSAVDHSQRKAQQIIDEQGTAIFDRGHI